ncbi:uncharacterized protein LOC108742399 isoform X2 [Agrilus planipennis]|uniref:Uncharacterized protein LOC108742399 isoform X2 n=1 Tax=Agrilus planipennis TaxID=224129 RepID=A0A1W4XL52_AGRPL|nr:uncharacterized protein LOC108742399 isoform X2 [Agrilus planipennis]
MCESAYNSPRVSRRWQEPASCNSSPARSLPRCTPDIFSTDSEGEFDGSASEAVENNFHPASTSPNETVLISGWLKFRDNKKWKQRWGVVSKLSPAADCLHLQLYRDSKERYKQGQTKASLSLEQFVALETGFTLDKESNTVALLCKDVVVVLAFDTRERLMQWQVKLATNLNAGPHFLVLLSSAPAKAKLPAGPARLHVHGQDFSLSSGVPPRLIGTWKLAYLRRYGVVDGRFCFEGGSRCGIGEGVHVLISDQAEEIVQVLQMASQGQLVTGSRRKTLSRNVTVTGSPRATPSRTDSRRVLELSDHHHLRSDSPFTDLESSYGCTGGTGGEMGLSMGAWADSASSMGIDRCLSCMSKLGAMSRSSTAAAMGHCGGGWGIEHTCDRRSLSSGSDYSTWSQIPTGKGIMGPGGTSSPKRVHSSSPSPLPPTENYDVPKIALPTELKPETAYYDTPRKIKECLASDTIRKPCGCVLRLRPSDVCPCHRLSMPSQEQIGSKEPSNTPQLPPKGCHDYANIEPAAANYTNLTFCRSLELYENAATIAKIVSESTPQMQCTECSHNQEDYLEMTPLKGIPGYLPMSMPSAFNKGNLDKGISNSNPNLNGQPIAKPPPLPLRQAQRNSSTEHGGGCRSPPPPPICSIKLPPCNCSVVRRSSSVPCKATITNRDSSSSADSGVWEASAPRRSRSYDPLRELNFRFQKSEEKSTSAEAAVPVCTIVPGSSNGSAASDLSDYLETLSTSSHSSAGGINGEQTTTSNPPSCMLRPRSGGEYLSLQRLIGPVPEERHD